MRSAAVVAMALLVGGCHTVSQEARLERQFSRRPCNAAPVGAGRMEVARAATTDAQLLARMQGALVLRTTIRVDKSTWVVGKSRVALGRGATGYSREVETDGGGWARLDSLSPGEVRLRALKIAFAPVYGTAEVRAGFVDTAQVLMKREFLCLAPLTTAALPN